MKRAAILAYWAASTQSIQMKWKSWSMMEGLGLPTTGSKPA